VWMVGSAETSDADDGADRRGSVAFDVDAVQPKVPRYCFARAKGPDSTKLEPSLIDERSCCSEVHPWEAGHVEMADGAPVFPAEVCVGARDNRGPPRAAAAPRNDETRRPES
jgi:hypothetical protein